MVLSLKMWIYTLQGQIYINSLNGPNYVLGSALLKYCCIYGILELGSSIIPFNWQLFHSLLSWLPVNSHGHSLSVHLSLFVCVSTPNRRHSELRSLYCCQRIKHRKRKQTSRRQGEVSLWSKIFDGDMNDRNNTATQLIVVLTIISIDHQKTQ